MAVTRSAEAQFTGALEALIAEVRKDRSVLAAVLCGSLSHDTVWEKSDIDLVFVTVDEQKALQEGLALNASGVNVHAMLLPRAEFRRIVEGATRNSFMHSVLAKGRLLYTHDESIAALCSRLGEIGRRDTQVQLFAAASNALAPIYKARKWFLTRGDLDYTALWILYAATPLARIEVMSAGLLADREVIPQALKLNPAFFTTIYTCMLNVKKTKKNVGYALKEIDRYMAERAATLFEPVIEHLRDVGEARSATEIDSYCRRNWNVTGAIPACEYLADQGLIGKVSTPAQLTKRSNVVLQELAFVYLGDPPDER